MDLSKLLCSFLLVATTTYHRVNRASLLNGMRARGRVKVRRLSGLPMRDIYPEPPIEAVSAAAPRHKIVFICFFFFHPMPVGSIVG